MKSAHKVWLSIAIISTAAASAELYRQHAESTGLGLRDGKPVIGERAVAAPTASAAPAPPAERSNSAVSRASSDFNGDGRSDIWLQNRSRGRMAYWLMSGSQPVEYSPAFTAPPQSRVAQGDLNGDGRLDIVWKDPGASETYSVWLSGASGFAGHAIPTPAAGWAITGVGDIDGNGRGDLLLTNGSHVAYWRMEGATVVGYSPQFPVPTGRVLVANGDFDADGRLDLVWANESERTLVLWQGHAGGGFTEQPIREYAVGWRVWGAGDFDGDGKADLVLGHRSNRLLAYWRMNGSVATGYSPAFRLPGTSRADTYGAIALGDYNGDHRLDVLLERSVDRSLVLWQGDGVGFQQLPVRNYTQDWRVIRPSGSSGTPTGPYVPDDMDGDGASDALLYATPGGAAPGEFKYAKLTGTTTEQISQRPIGCDGATILVTGDFDGDEASDLVVADNCGSGRVFMRLSGPGSFADVTLPTPAAGWRFVGAGDVDGDGRSDLLLGEYGSTAFGSMSGFAYWVMRGARIVEYSPGFLTTPLRQVLAAKGDFNGDGILDLVWSRGGARTQSEPMDMWVGDGAGFIAYPLPPTSPQWGVTGAGDIDGDGLSDLLLSTYQDGYDAYWLMDGTSPKAFSPVLTFAGTVRQVGDYNGDGRADILLYRAVTTFRGAPLYTEYNLATAQGEGFVTTQVLKFLQTPAPYRVFGDIRIPY